MSQLALAASCKAFEEAVSTHCGRHVPVQAQPFLSSPVGQPVSQYDLRIVIEQLTQQLLKLDNVEGGGEIRAARKSQIARIESLADALERLKS